MTQTVHLDVQDGLARLTLTNGKKGNPLDMSFGSEIKAAAIELQARDDLRAVLLTAEGKNFSVGGNLASFASVEDLPTYVRASTADYHAALGMLLRLRAPIVSAVQGAVAGAGVALAVFSDIVIAAEDSNFTMAYTAIGFSPDGASTYVLPRLVGMRKFQELVLTNRTVDANEALNIGLITEIVPNDDLLEHAEKTARRLASGPTQAYAATRRLLLETFDNSLDTHLAREVELLAAVSASDDVSEGIQAALERRKASFKGR
ncbi:MAG: enoyl-CoA hydratase/isomerase family protein [Pseudomonadota bacterium]